MKAICRIQSIALRFCGLLLLFFAVHVFFLPACHANIFAFQWDETDPAEFSSYRIYYSTNLADLNPTGLAAIRAAGNNAVSGYAEIPDNDPEVSYSVTVSFNEITDVNTDYYFAVVGVDAGGSEGAPSNVSGTHEPTIDTLDPVAGTYGTNVTITGGHFFYGATVRFGATEAENVNLTPMTEIACTVPTLTSGNIVDVAVVNTSGAQTASPPQFAYDNATPTVTIESINQNTGTDTIYTNVSQISVTLLGSDDYSVNQYLILDSDSNPANGTFAEIPGGIQYFPDFLPFEVDFTLNSQIGDGSRTIYAWVKDEVEPSAYAQRENVFLDTQRPTAEISSPAKSTTILPKTLAALDLLSGTAEDPLKDGVNSGIRTEPTLGIEIRVTDGTNDLAYDSVQDENYWAATPTWFTPAAVSLPDWSHDVSAAAFRNSAFNLDNTYTMYARATDRAGNVSVVDQNTFKFDTDGDGIPNAQDDDKDGDGMPNDWEAEWGLDPLDSTDAAGDLDEDDIDNLHEYLDGTDPTFNSTAVQAVLFEPAPGETDVALAPTLTTMAYGGTKAHTKTHWQISRADNDTDDTFSEIVFDVTSPTHLESVPVPEFVLDPMHPSDPTKQWYSWRARFYDEDNGGVQWSEARWFKTISADPLVDENGNGIPDEQDLNGVVDLDGDGTPDSFTGPFAAIDIFDGTAQVVLEAPVGTTIEFFKSVDPKAIPDSANKPDPMPLGLVQFKISGIDPAVDKVAVNLHFSQSMEGSTWYKYSPITGWWNYTNNTYIVDNTVTLEIVDGGVGDADGTKNGIIVDPSGAGASSSAPVAPSAGGGGGCFIATAAYGSALDRHVQVLSEFRDRWLLPYSWGKRFVDWYYRVSPDMVCSLENHPGALPLVRWALLPVVGFSYLSVAVHPAFAVGVYLMVLGLFVCGIRKLYHIRLR